MRLDEHQAQLAAGNIDPRVVQHGEGSEALYVAWAPTWEGAARPDYPAALADLNDYLRTSTLYEIVTGRGRAFKSVARVRFKTEADALHWFNSYPLQGRGMSLVTHGPKGKIISGANIARRTF